MQRRLAWRNERVFYSDHCQKCQRPIVSQFSPEEKLIVYCETCYWADGWAGQDYAQDFDFSKTFGEQFNQLNRAVPHMAMIHTKSTNAEYTHLAANNNNSYLLIESSDNENCNYSYWLQNSRDCFDSSFSIKSELLYWSDNLEDCYKVFYSRSSQQCSNSYFLLNCHNVKNSFGCVNLSNQKYCIFNEPKTKVEYEQFIHILQLDTWEGVGRARQLVAEFTLKQPHKYSEIYEAERSTGNYQHHTKDCQWIFHGYEAEAAHYGEHVWRGARDVMDVNTVGIKAELVYDAINTALNVYQMRFTNQCWHHCNNVDYSMYCGSLQNGFGCVAIKKGQNLIFNKPIGEMEFKNLAQRIQTHMVETKEWGMFLDPKYSLFGYNETIASEQFPLSQAEVQLRGWRWRKNLPGTFGPLTKPTPNIASCHNCAKQYRFISQELAFYKANAIPLPQLCPDCRHRSRMKERNPNYLWQRQCMCTQIDHQHSGRCATNFETTYSPDRKEIVYCEECYKKEVY
ncbi:MAG TPA: hypothetical protein DEG44_02370 [Candidatus Kerfeldbacteria bacterium]|nr:hypothetical protein [Candidatus Kerfeldbacteria bacterium]